MSCDEHIHVERELAAARAGIEYLKAEDSESKDSLIRIDVRLRGIEVKLARYAGILAAISLIPTILKLSDWLIPAARAALGN